MEPITVVGTSSALVPASTGMIAAVGATGVSAWATLNTYFVGLGCSGAVATGASVVTVAAVVIGVVFIGKYIWNGIANLWRNRATIVGKAKNAVNNTASTVASATA